MTSDSEDKYESYDFVMQDGCIVAGIEPYPPYTIVKGKTFEGGCVEVFKILMNKLGLCYKFVRSPNSLWGTEYENGTWTGLIGLAQRKEVEILVCPVATSYKRYQAIDFSEPVISTDYSIVYPRPLLEPNFAGFVMPFSYQSWILLLSTLIFTSVLSVILNKTLFVRFNEKIRKKNPHGPSADLPNDLWFRGVIAQPITKSPEQIGSRFLIAVWLLVMVILGETFKCNLKALLIVPKVRVPFDTLEELVKQNGIKWSYLEGSVIPQYFETAYNEDPNSPMGKGWSGRGELYSNAGYILEFVVDRGMACISLKSKVKQLISYDYSKTGKCRLATATEPVISTDLTFGLKKRSKLASLINPYIMKLKEAGILSKIFSKETINASFCDVRPGEEMGHKLRPLTIMDFLGIFSILGTGLVLATIVLLLEIAKKKMEDSRSGQK